MKKLINLENMVLVVILIGVTFLYLQLNRIPQIHTFLINFNQSLIDYSTKLGIVGAFVICLVSNATLLVPIPYNVAIIYLGSQATSYAYLVALTIASTIGMVLGEVVSYYWGRGVGYLFDSSKDYQRIHQIKELLIKRPKLAPLLVFLFAVTPLPDDFVLIPLGYLKYDLWKMVVPSLIGKFFVAVAYVFGGYYSVQWISENMQQGAMDPTLFLLVLTWILVVIAYYSIVKLGRRKRLRIQLEGNDRID